MIESTGFFPMSQLDMVNVELTFVFATVEGYGKAQRLTMAQRIDPTMQAFVKFQEQGKTMQELSQELDNFWGSDTMGLAFCSF